jgi:alpha-L-rhamnosidase
MLGNGWYAGYLGWSDQRHVYGDQLALSLELCMEYEDGSKQVIVTDDSWRTTGSPILMSEIYHGETYDARLELPGWSAAGYNDDAWQAVKLIAQSNDVLIMQENDPVRKVEELKPIALITTPRGETVLDMGQNMVGWLRFTVQGEAGREVSVHHAEVLDQEGNFYTDNLRSAKQEIRYVLKGGGKETYEPYFTFQGFRYVRLTGFANEISLDDFTGVVLYTDMTATGSFECSDPMVNQLQHNIEWGLKGNFLDVPTDCPQRDERLGWTGDAQMFVRTAAYLRNVAPFFTKWGRDLAADQTSDGGVPFVIPQVLAPNSHSSSAWGDAAIICPWTIYLVYGDKRILEEQYASMQAWVNYIRKQGDNEYLWNTGFHFGDWLGLDAKPDTYVGATDKDYIASAFYAYCVGLMKKIAEILGRDADARDYEEWHERIIEAFSAEFITPSGRLSVPTQTAQLLALMFGLVDGVAKERSVSKLIALLEESKFHLTTGFVGTPYMNLVLSENGHSDAAYKLLFQQDYPSWLYPITKGATTIWEHWDGIKPDGSFWSKDMNSFNHYAYGAIGDWLYRYVAGIDTDERLAGYKHHYVKPQPGEGLTWADARLETMYGEVRSAWRKLEDGGMTLTVHVPANTTAEILLPDAELAAVLESGHKLAGGDGDDAADLVAGIAAAKQIESGVLVNAGSGEYTFTWK